MLQLSSKISEQIDSLSANMVRLSRNTRQTVLQEEQAERLLETGIKLTNSMMAQLRTLQASLYAEYGEPTTTVSKLKVGGRK